jgi:predicted MFS family arabinose efflux permease
MEPIRLSGSARIQARKIQIGSAILAAMATVGLITGLRPGIGTGMAAGLFVGGSLNDRLGHRAVIGPGLLFLALAFFSLATTAGLLSQRQVLVPFLVAIAVWGVAAGAFFPAQQARLIGIAGIKLAPIALSLHASFMFIGFSLGAAVGSFTLAHGSAIAPDWVGGSCEIAALLLMLAAQCSVRLATAWRKLPGVMIPACATFTECSLPSRLCDQKSRKRCRIGNFGARSSSCQM